MQPLKILLVGCGKMGGALLEGWLEAGICKHIYVISPDTNFSNTKVTTLNSVSELSDSVDVVFFAVKPQILDTVVPLYKDVEAVFISIAAGKSITSISNAFADNKRRSIIRVMPNTPAAIGRGISGVFANDVCDQTDQAMAEELMAVCGDVIWLDKEQDMHVVTAVSGSGPAYLFHMIEALTQAAEKQGLNKEQALLFARKTIEGAAALSSKNPDVSASTLREAVTSPKGTTEAGLTVLMPSLPDLMTRTVVAAKKRSIELDQES